MFEFIHLSGGTYYFQSFSNVGIYEKGDGKVILIDACDHKRMVRSINNYLDKKELTIETVINTHCHVDHICGNKTFKDKYGCKILSTRAEQPFIYYTQLEPSFYFAGIDTDKSRNPFFMIEPSESEVITEENTPDGFEIIPLPGHSFEMIGVRTPDDIVFLADSILAERTWREHRMPFFHNVNESIKTLKKLKTLEAKLFVPAHDEPSQDIKALADYNIERLNNLKSIVLDLCEGKGFDELFGAVMKALDLNIKTEKYPTYAVMVRNILQALVEDEKIKAVMDGINFIYHRV